VPLPEDVTDDVRRRLRRVAGQVQGIERMLADGRDCREVIQQLSAAIRALERAGFRLVSAGLAYCLESPDEAAVDGYAMDSLQRLFMTLA